MEDEYEYTPPDDTIVLDSPDAEARLLNLDMNTEIVDVYESIKHSGNQTEDYPGEEVVLDSDDERLGQNENDHLVNGECFPLSERLSGGHTMGKLKTRRIRAGHFRRLDNKVKAHRFDRLDLARSAWWVEESNAGRAFFNNNGRCQDHVVMDCVVSKTADQISAPSSAEELHVEPKYLNMVRESLTKKSLDEKLSPNKSKTVDMEKDTNYDFEHEMLNYIQSPEHADSNSKALDFVDHYLSASDLGSYKDVETRKSERIKSPPSLKSKGIQMLARRVNVETTATKSMIFDWTEEQLDKGEYSSLRKTKDPIFGFLDDNSGYLSLNQESGNVKLQKEKVSSPNSKEEQPGNISSPINLDSNSIDSNDLEKIGSNSEIYIAYDSLDIDQQFDAGLSRQNVEKDEQVNAIPDAFDIGLDTQIAAEAMEALVHAAPPMSDAAFAHKCSDDTFMDSYNSANRKSKSKQPAQPEEAFFGWRKKEKRSKCVKIPTDRDKNIYSSVEKRSKKQRRIVGKVMTEKLLRGKDLSSINTGNTKNWKCGVSTRITVLPDQQHIERDSLTEFKNETSDVVKSDSLPKRRKMSSFHDDVNNWKLNSDSSFQVTTDADKSLLKLNPWIHPKGKRTRKYMPQHSIKSSNQCSTSLAIENNVEKCRIVSEEAHRRVEGLLVYTRRHQFSSKSKHLENSLERTGHSTSPSVKHNAFPMKFHKSDEGHFPNAANTSCNMKADVLSNGNCKTQEVFQGRDRLKQPSRSTLLKELTRLGYTESLPNFLPKDSRRRRAMKKCCILFSQNLESSILKQQKKIVARLGFSITSRCSDATHFVTDYFVRTRNMLEAIALGKPVVTHLWLESCEQAGYFIDEKNYILRDEKKEKEIGFNMPVSLSRASQRPLLKGRRVLVTPNVKPSVDAINCLVKAVHGETVENILSDKTKKAFPDDLLILSCEEDYRICVPFIEKGASVYNSELLLNGIVTQRLEYKRHQLFEEISNNSYLL